jgi:replicative DNA helicase
MVIGADSGDGKTSLAMQFILHSAALSGKRWLMVSKEMTPEQLARRVLLMRANVNNLEIRRAQMDGMALSHETWTRLNDAREELEALQSSDGTPHIMIVPPGHISAQAVCSMIRREKMARGLDAFVVDYLQILNKPLGAKMSDSEEEKIRMDCQGFKDIAMEERLSGVILSQFAKRGGTVRSKDGVKPRPIMDDLKGSQGVQAAADIILLLHRPEPPDQFNTGLTYPVDCIVAKGRYVGIGDVHLDFEPQFTRFSDRNSSESDEGEPKW